MTDVVNIRVRADSAEVDRASDALGRFTRRADGVGSASGSLASSNRRASDSLREVEQSGQRATSALQGIFALISGVGVLSMLKMVDSYNSTNALLKVVTDSTEEYTRTQKELFDLAQDNFQSIDATTRQYAGQAKQLADMGRTHEEAIQVIDLFGKSLATSGATATEASSATLQWTQAISSGVLRGEEFNSIMENGRGVAMALADGLGVSIGQLRQMAKDGKLSAEVVVTALLSQSESIRKRFADMPLSIDNAWVNLTNSVTKKLAEIDKEFGVTAGVANFLKDISLALDDTNGKFDITNAVIATLGAIAIPILLTIASALGTATVAAAAFAFTPIGAIVIGLTAAVGAVLYLRNEMVTFGDNTATVMDWAVAIFQWGSDKLIGFFQAIATAVSSNEMGFSFETLTSFFGDVLDGAKIAINAVINLFIGAGQAIIYAWNNIPDGIYNIFASIYNSVVTTMNNLIADIISPLNTVMSAVGMSTISVSSAFEQMEQRSDETTTSMSHAFLSAFETDHVGLFAADVTKSFREIRGEVGKLAEQRAAVRLADKLSESYAAMNEVAKPVAQTFKKNTAAIKEQKKAANELVKSKDKLSESFSGELVNLEKERLQIGKNELALYKFGLEQKTFGKNSLRYSETQIAALVADKKRNIELKASELALKKADEAQEKINKSIKESTEARELETGAVGMSEDQYKFHTLTVKDKYTPTKALAKIADDKHTKSLEENRKANWAATEAVEASAKAFELESKAVGMSEEQYKFHTLTVKDKYTPTKALAKIADDKHTKSLEENRKANWAATEAVEASAKAFELESKAVGMSEEQYKFHTLTVKDKYTPTKALAKIADDKHTKSLEENRKANWAATEAVEASAKAFELESKAVGMSEEQYKFHTLTVKDKYTPTKALAKIADDKHTKSLEENRKANWAATEAVEASAKAFELESKAVGMSEEQYKFHTLTVKDKYTPTKALAKIADDKHTKSLEENRKANWAATEAVEASAKAFELESKAVGMSEEQYKFHTLTVKDKYTPTKALAKIADDKHTKSLEENRKANWAATEAVEASAKAFELESKAVGMSEEQYKFHTLTVKDKYTPTKALAKIADDKHTKSLEENRKANWAATEAVEASAKAFELESKAVGMSEEQYKFHTLTVKDKYTPTKALAKIADDKHTKSLEENRKANWAATEAVEASAKAFELESKAVGMSEEQYKFHTLTVKDKYTPTKALAKIADDKHTKSLEKNRKASWEATKTIQKLKDKQYLLNIEMTKGKAAAEAAEMSLKGYGEEQIEIIQILGDHIEETERLKTAYDDIGVILIEGLMSGDWKSAGKSLLGTLQSTLIDPLKKTLSEGISNALSTGGSSIGQSLSGIMGSLQGGGLSGAMTGGGLGMMAGQMFGQTGVGSGIGGAIGTVFGGPIGAALGSLAGGLIESLFGGKSDVESTFSNRGEALEGSERDQYWYSTRRAPSGAQWHRESEFGQFGIQRSGSVSIGRDDPKQVEELQGMLDRVAQMDSVIASFLPASVISDVRARLDGFEMSGLDMTATLRSRMKEIYSALPRSIQFALHGAERYMSASAEEMAERFLYVAQVAEQVTPVLAALGLTTEQSWDKAILSSVRLTDALGGVGPAMQRLNFYAEQFIPATEQFSHGFSNARNTLFDFNEAMGLTGSSVITSHDGLRRYIEAQDISTTAGANAAAAALEVAASVDFFADAISSITGMFSSTIEQIELDLLSQEELTTRYMTEAAALFEQLQAESDPGRIAEISEQINSAVNSAWSSMTEEQKAANADYLTSMLTASSDFAEQSLLGALTSADLMAQAIEGMSVPASIMNDASRGMQSAASTIANAAANIPNPISVVVDSNNNVDGSHATGLASVPFDRYVGELHKGEMVLDASTAASLKRYGIPVHNPRPVNHNVIDARPMFAQQQRNASDKSKELLLNEIRKLNSNVEQLKQERRDDAKVSHAQNDELIDHADGSRTALNNNARSQSRDARKTKKAANSRWD